MASKKRAPHEAWRAVMQMADDDEMDRLVAMSDDEVDAELREAGFDVAEVEREGEALVNDLRAKRAPAPEWQTRARARLERVRAIAAGGAQRREKLSRKELRERIELARNDARFAAPVAALFRGRGEDESSDEELEAILDEIELLQKLADDDGAGGEKK